MKSGDTMESYVTHSECEKYRDRIEKEITDNSMKIVEINTSLKSLVNTVRAILGVVSSGVVAIIVDVLLK